MFLIPVLGLVLGAFWFRAVCWMNPYVEMGHHASEAAEALLLDKLRVPPCDDDRSPQSQWRCLTSCLHRYDCIRVFWRTKHRQGTEARLFGRVGISELAWVVTFSPLVLYGVLPVLLAVEWLVAGKDVTWLIASLTQKAVDWLIAWSTWLKL